ncbi:hypothetical protein HYU09_03215 [Candidatus Woesearchaeota archaeon]|nr:hypothetical protein [Candidatus Woesearchaeota archaeon]
MLSKKAAIPAEELLGMLSYVMLMVIVILLFYGCNISNAKESNEQEKSIERGISAAKHLNNFLEMPVGSGKDMYGMMQEAYAANDFSGIGRISKDFFSQKYSRWSIIISDESKSILYSSKSENAQNPEAKSEAQVPIFEAANIKFLTVSLEVYA